MFGRHFVEEQYWTCRRCARMRMWVDGTGGAPNIINTAA